MYFEFYYFRLLFLLLKQNEFAMLFAFFLSFFFYEKLNHAENDLLVDIDGSNGKMRLCDTRGSTVFATRGIQAKYIRKLI